jgi:hypothetical protein
MANLATTQTECSDTSSELLQLLVNFARDAEGQHGMGARSNQMTSLILMLNAPTHVEGLITVRGKMIPIISLRG